MSYVGNPIDTQNTFQSLVGKRFSGDGSTTAFTLDVAPSSTLDIEVFVGNVRQDPNSAYTLSGTTLTFTGAPPSGTNNIYVVHQAKSVGTIDVPSSYKSDAQTISGARTFSGTTTISGALTASGGVTLSGTTPTLTIGDAGAEDVKIQFDGNAQDFYIGLDDSGDELQIGKGSTLGAGRELSFGASGPVFNEDSDTHDFRIESDDNTHAFFVHGSQDRINMFNSISSSPAGNTNDEYGLFMANGGGTTLNTDGDAFNVNRQNSDGSVIGIRQEGQGEGDISVSGTTVSYNTFCGAHWSRLADNSKPTILRGTVIESIGTMMDWYNLDIKDENNKTIAKESINLPSGKSVGDSHTVVKDGVTYTGIISKEDNEQLPKCKISDTADSKAVYGVFMRWDDADDGLDGDVNDMNVAALGAFVIRVHKDQTVAIGDYLVSNGDGTAKKQADDILRASTIAKVTSTEKTHEHADGSYCVPCVLHCG